jgi:hypothetical protein
MTPGGIFISKTDAHDLISILPAGKQDWFWDHRLRNNYMTEHAQPCAVRNCPNLDTQEHHIAPRSLERYFDDDWLNFPTIYLCQFHHRQWHEVVTWYLPGYQQRLGEFAAKYLRNGNGKQATIWTARHV